MYLSMSFIKRLWPYICLICFIFVILIYREIPSFRDVTYSETSIRRERKNILSTNVHHKPETEAFRKDIIVFYNRIPKTGSTSFVNVAYDLCAKNSFHVIHINITKNAHYMSLADQRRFVDNVTHWESKKPVLYHGHIGFINFQKFASTSPLFINILREPLDRIVSYFYFLRYGDNYRPHLIRKKHGNKMTFDECVEQGKPECHPDTMWLQIPFLCGHSFFCWLPGNEWALQEAKRNLINQYFLVGVTEDISGFLSVLEVLLPEFFIGASEHFASNGRNHLRKTKYKIEPSPNTIAMIHKSKIWRMEYDLYKFALQQFNFIKQQMILSENGTISGKGIQFRYEKIYPKSGILVT